MSSQYIRNNSLLNVQQDNNLDTEVMEITIDKPIEQQEETINSYKGGSIIDKIKQQEKNYAIDRIQQKLNNNTTELDNNSNRINHNYFDDVVDGIVDDTDEELTTLTSETSEGLDSDDEKKSSNSNNSRKPLNKQRKKDNTNVVQHKHTHHNEKQVQKATVCYDFKGEGNQELSVRKGEIVDVLKKYDDGWTWCVKKEEQNFGLVPTAYLRFLDQKSIIRNTVLEDERNRHLKKGYISSSTSSNSLSQEDEDSKTTNEEEEGKREWTLVPSNSSSTRSSVQPLKHTTSLMIPNSKTIEERRNAISKLPKDRKIEVKQLPKEPIVEDSKKKEPLLKRLGSLFSKKKKEVKVAEVEKRASSPIIAQLPNESHEIGERELLVNSVQLKPHASVMIPNQRYSTKEYFQHVEKYKLRPIFPRNVMHDVKKKIVGEKSDKKSEKKDKKKKIETIEQTEEANALVRKILAFKRRRAFRLALKDEKYKKQRKRKELIKETIETERTYVDSLKVLIELFYYPLVNDTGHGKGVMEREHIHAIFSNIEQIYQINSTLLSDLDKAFEKYPFVEIAPALSQITPFFKTYTTYVNNFENSQSTLERLKREDRRVKEFLMLCHKQKKTKGNQIGSYLILPIQRIPRYRMLLTEILNNTSSNHVEYECLKKCVKEIETVANYVNDEKRKVEQNQIVFEVQSLIHKQYPSFVQPNRKFIRRGTMNVQYIIYQTQFENDVAYPFPTHLTKPDQYLFDVYLFNDIIVLIEQEKVTTSNNSLNNKEDRQIHFIFLQFVYNNDFTILDKKKKKSFIDSPIQLVSNHNKKRGSLRVNSMDLENLNITVEDEEDYTFTIEVLFKGVKQEYIFHTSNLNEKQSWMQSIGASLMQINKNNISKGIENDFYLMGKERANLHRIAKEKLEEHQKLEKANLMKMSYVSQLDTHLQKKKQLLMKLQKEISILEMDKSQVVHEMESLQNKKSKIREDLKFYSTSIQERDMYLMKLLNQETDAFKLIFDDAPSVGTETIYAKPNTLNKHHSAFPISLSSSSVNTSDGYLSGLTRQNSDMFSISNNSSTQQHESLKSDLSNESNNSNNNSLSVVQTKNRSFVIKHNRGSTNNITQPLQQQ
ncbi:hypothetical protein ABK040_011748 [Willaertia magna]